MTAEPIRDIGFASWKDPDAWMESMDGPRWKELISEENNRVKHFIEKNDIQKLKDTYKSLIHPTPNQDFNYKAGAIEIKKLNAFFLEWRWSVNSKKIYEARDVWADTHHAWTIQDTGQGSESFTLSCYSENRKLPLWKKTPVGPDIAIKDDVVVYLGVRNKLWYNEVWIANKTTGANSTLIYKELNPECNLSIVRREGGRVIVVRENAQEKEYYEVHKTPNKVELRSISKSPDPSNIPGIQESHGVNWYEPGYNLCSTRSHGKQSLWRISPLQHILTIPLGSIEIDPWAVHESAEVCILTIQTPTNGIQRIQIHKSKPNEVLPTLSDISSDRSPYRYQIKRYKSSTAYYAVLTKGDTKPKKALVIGYGAYGLPTSSSYAGGRWNPLLQNGWAIVYTFIRGGGDHTDAWATSGRRSGRALTIQDFLNCIYSFKNIYSILPKNIVIYGRSAGGLLVGNSLAKAPNGTLFGGIFAEVPYVDVLRTTTNPTLPLTKLEYNEFGNPVERLDDFLSVGSMSPTDLAINLKTPNIFIYCRTAENDSEVYTYEPVKWIRRLRDASPHGKPKLLRITLGAGHFTNPGEISKDAYAEDCAILEALTR